MLNGGEGFGIALAIFGAASAIFSAFFVARANGKIAHAQAQTIAAQIWEGEAKAIRVRADRLQTENSELTATVRELSARTDLSQVLELLGEQTRAGSTQTQQSLAQVAQHFENHENRASERHRVTLEAFGHLNQGLSSMSRLLASQAHDAEGRSADADRGRGLTQ